MMRAATHPSPLAEKLQDLLRQRGWSAAELARRAGVNDTLLRDIFRGRALSPKIDNVQKLARALGVPLSDLAPDGEISTAPTAGALHHDELEPWDPTLGGTAIPVTDGQLTNIWGQGVANAKTLRLRESVPGFGFFAGDILIIDTKARAEQGDIVAVTAIDPNTGRAYTLVRRYLHPYLVSGDPLDRHPLLADGNRYTILGPVCASMRTIKF